MSVKIRIAKLWAAMAARANAGELKLTGQKTIYVYADDLGAPARIEAAIKAGDRYVVFEPDPNDANVWARPPADVID